MLKGGPIVRIPFGLVLGVGHGRHGAIPAVAAGAAFPALLRRGAMCHAFRCGFTLADDHATGGEPGRGTLRDHMGGNACRQVIRQGTVEPVEGTILTRRDPSDAGRSEIVNHADIVQMVSILNVARIVPSEVWITLRRLPFQ